jgi:hypothetical protein
MNSIRNVSWSSNTYFPTNQNSFVQSLKDFKAIGSALQSGDLSTAQSALATFQKDLQNNPQASDTQPFGKNSQANTDYQSLVSAVQSGDLSSAQKAFSSLQSDFKSVHKGHHHHHHGSEVPAATTPTTVTGSTSSEGDQDSTTLDVTA